MVARAGKEAALAGDLAALGRAMNANHRLLRALEVSTPGLERLIEAAKAAGALGAKLTGGGLGGSIVALAPQLDLRPALTRAGARFVMRG